MRKIRKFEHRQFFYSPEVMLVVQRHINHNLEPRHRHDFVELVVVLAGTALHEVGSHHYRLEAGDVFVIHPPLTHGYYETDGFHIINVLIRKEFLSKLAPGITALPDYPMLFRPKAARHREGARFECRTHLTGEHFEQASQWIAVLERENRPGILGGYAMAEAGLLLLIGLICRAGVPRSLPLGSTPSRIGRLLSWMEQRLEMPIRVADMARVAMMSERTLLRRFEEVTKQTPLAYLTELRLNRAQALLAGPEQPLSTDEIASRCGLENGNYLARRFKQHFGMSPRDWRKSRRAVTKAGEHC